MEYRLQIGLGPVYLHLCAVERTFSELQSVTRTSAYYGSFYSTAYAVLQILRLLSWCRNSWRLRGTCSLRSRVAVVAQSEYLEI